jgi:hypothetical protein
VVANSLIHFYAKTTIHDGDHFRRALFERDSFVTGLDLVWNKRHSRRCTFILVHFIMPEICLICSIA